MKRFYAGLFDAQIGAPPGDSPLRNLFTPPIQQVVLIEETVSLNSSITIQLFDICPGK